MPLKIPNPTTDPAVWDSGINLFAELDGYAFNHKAMGRVIVRSNLMGAQGRTGEQAIAASAQAPDASRDSVPMMAKQYSNIFRAIGLILPVEFQGKKSLYIISPLLKHLASIKDRDERISQFWKYLIRAYVNPCHHLGKSKSSSKIRPNVAVMRMQIDLDGGCIPYEILIGPQCQLSDDRDVQQYQSMIDSIRDLRKGKTKVHLYDTVRSYHERMLSGEFGGDYNVGSKHISEGNIKKARDTWNNWTRVTSAAGLNARICELDRTNLLGYNFREKSARMLTKEGHKFAKRITNMRDFRAEDLEQWPEGIRSAMLRVVNDNLLMEWGVKIDESRMKLDLQSLRSYNEEIYRLLTDNAILHTPFSEHSTQILIEANLIDCSNLTLHPYCFEDAPELIEAPIIELKQLEEFPELKPFPPEPFPWQGLSDSQILEKFANSDAKKFGPAVGKCFKCLGMQWELGSGIIDRTDGKASFANGYFIPVELKSPRETPHLNPKSVQQAAENAMLAPQIAQDSSKGQKHSVATASLVIGWKLPLKRSDFEELIQRNMEHWRIRIRAFVFSDLIKMARSASQGREIDFNEILSKSGIYRWDEHE